MVRQGDILFIPVKATEDFTVVQRVDDGIIAEGEATGHHHRIAEADLAGAELYEVNFRGEKMLRVTAEGGIAIVHEEHGTVRLTPGTYKIHQAREYDYLANIVRRVRD